MSLCEHKTICQLTFQEHKYISLKRIAHLYSSKPQPQEFTVLVSGVPLVSGNSISETVESFFREYHSSTYLSHVVVHRTDKLKVLMVQLLPTKYSILPYNLIFLDFIYMLILVE